MLYLVSYCPSVIRKRKKMVGESSRCRNLESMLQDIQAKPCNLSLELLSDITDNFSDKREIGRGGFGVVYKVK